MQEIRIFYSFLIYVIIKRWHHSITIYAITLIFNLLLILSAMQEGLLYSAEYRQQASQTINSFVVTMTDKMERIKLAYQQGIISFDQLVVGRTKLLREAAATLHASYSDPAIILQQLTAALQFQQAQLRNFSVLEFVDTV
jgi:hypothetical protein